MNKAQLGNTILDAALAWCQARNTPYPPEGDGVQKLCDLNASTTDALNAACIEFMRAHSPKRLNGLLIKP